MSQLTLSRNRIATLDDNQSSTVGLSESINLKSMYIHYYFPMSRENLYKEFYELESEWKNDTKYFSSLTDICMHESYQRIIGMGRDVVPLILYELEKEPYHWYWALTAITGEDPVPQEYRGKMTEMRKVWLEWAQRHSFIK